jgi:hypothetical protein
MPEAREIIRRALEGVESRPDAFQHTLDRVRRRDQHRRFTSVVVATVVVAGAGAGLWATLGPLARKAPSVSPTSGESARLEDRRALEKAARLAWSELPEGWSRLPDPPVLDEQPVAVWTGAELFFWGEKGDQSGSDGALYYPATREWRQLPEAPIVGRSYAGAVWTGSEVIVWGGETPTGDYRGSLRYLNDGAAFDPLRHSWRVLPQSPLSAREPVIAVWTGSEMIVWGGGSSPLLPSRADGAAYSPLENRWRAIASAPLHLNLADAVWTGEEVIVYGAHLDYNNASDRENPQGMAYNPTTDSWRVIAPFPLSPQATSAIWTGTEMLAWDYIPSRAGFYDPTTDTWRRLDRVPVDSVECYPESALVDRRVLAWECGSAALLDPSSLSWERVSPPPGHVDGDPVSAGSVVLFPGFTFVSGPPPQEVVALWAYKPPA